MNIYRTLSGHRGRITAAILGIAVLLLSGAVSAATVTLTGKGTYFVSRDLMPLGNGGAAVHTTNTTVVSVEPGETGIMFGECAGLAYLSPESTYASHIYCNFTEDGDDVFVVQGEVTPEGGAIKIIGGSGKWKGATGTGTLNPIDEAENKGHYSYEFKITTP